jgi:hypothetical protein
MLHSMSSFKYNNFILFLKKIWIFSNNFDYLYIIRSNENVDDDIAFHSCGERCRVFAVWCDEQHDDDVIWRHMFAQRQRLSSQGTFHIVQRRSQTGSRRSVRSVLLRGQSIFLIHIRIWILKMCDAHSLTHRAAQPQRHVSKYYSSHQIVNGILNEQLAAY